MVAAIGSYCDARARGGNWHVRIDDLDPPRVAQGAVDAILRGLEAHGLQWDGEIVCQSRRSEAYHVALHRLREAGRVFACGCSRRRAPRSRSIRAPAGQVCRPAGRHGRCACESMT